MDPFSNHALLKGELVKDLAMHVQLVNDLMVDDPMVDVLLLSHRLQKCQRSLLQIRLGSIRSQRVARLLAGSWLEGHAWLQVSLRQFVSWLVFVVYSDGGGQYEHPILLHWLKQSASCCKLVQSPHQI